MEEGRGTISSQGSTRSTQMPSMPPPQSTPNTEQGNFNLIPF